MMLMRRRIKYIELAGNEVARDTYIRERLGKGEWHLVMVIYMLCVMMFFCYYCDDGDLELHCLAYMGINTHGELKKVYSFYHRNISKGEYPEIRFFDLLTYN